MPGCMDIGRDIGSPNIPVKFVKFLIPPGYTIDRIESFGDALSVDTKVFDVKNTPIIPYQKPVPISGNQSLTAQYDYDEEIYNSTQTYPSNPIKNKAVEYCRGYQIVSFGINPIQYIPLTGELSYFPTITLHIQLKPYETVNPLYRNNEQDALWVQKLVQNPMVTEEYDTYYSHLNSLDYAGGLCDPSDNYDYVIITTQQNGLDDWSTSSSLPFNWTSLM